MHCHSKASLLRVPFTRDKQHPESEASCRRNAWLGSLGASGTIPRRAKAPLGSLRPHRRRFLDICCALLLARRGTKSGAPAALRNRSDGICRGVEEIFEILPQTRPANRFARTIIPPIPRVDSTEDLPRAACGQAGSSLSNNLRRAAAGSSPSGMFSIYRKEITNSS
jgi:hypothetical protein